MNFIHEVCGYAARGEKKQLRLIEQLTIVEERRRF